MRRFGLIILALVVAISGLLAWRATDIAPTPKATTPEVATTTAQLVRVVDGDTIDVSINGSKESVRIIGIDAPEARYGSVMGPACYAIEARDTLTELLSDGNVLLHQDALSDNRDKHGRLLRHVYTAAGTNTAAALLRLGVVKTFPYFPFEHKQKYQALEKRARRDNKGLWSTCSSMGSRM